MTDRLEVAAVMAALDGIADPCLGAAGLPLSIIDLGLIGDVEIDGDEVRLEITFTEPGCMFTHRIISQIHDRLRELGVSHTQVTPRWAPTWTERRLSPAAAREFGEIRGTYGEVLKPSTVRRTTTRMDEAAAASS